MSSAATGLGWFSTFVHFGRVRRSWSLAARGLEPTRPGFGASLFRSRQGRTSKHMANALTAGNPLGLANLARTVQRRV